MHPAAEAFRGCHMLVVLKCNCILLYLTVTLSCLKAAVLIVRIVKFLSYLSAKDTETKA